MMYNLYSIKDVVSGEYGYPMAIMNDNLARRTFFELGSNSKEMQDFPNDFELWRVGTFDSQRGTVKEQEKTFLQRGYNIKEMNKNEI
ncbi:nonstructural protein [Capybara microvirus Cap3_SP_433]|nr:nonstructural protein [Capybara microvirus Cap3_SP_433]